MQRSSTALPPKVHAAHVGVPRDENTKSPGGVPTGLRFLLIGVVTLLLLAAGGTFAYGVSHNGRVFRGVQVLGKDLGGMNLAEARAALSQAAAGYPSGSIAASGTDHNWTLQPSDLGIAVDVDKTAADALAIGHSGDLFGNLGAQLHALFGGNAITPVLKSDPALIDKAVARIASEVDRPAVSSTLVRQDGKATLTPSSHGTVVDREATKAAFASAALSLPFAPVNVVMKDQAPQVTEDQLKGAEAQALLFTDQPVILRSGDQSWTLNSNDLGQMLDISSSSPGSADVSVKLQDQALNTYLQPVAEAVKVDPKDATVVVGKGTVTLKPDKSGSELDFPAAVAAIQKAATGTDEASRTVELPLKEVSAAVHTADVQGLYDKANSLVTEGVRLRFRDDGYIMRGTAITGFIDTAINKDTNKLELTVDQAVLADRVSGIAYYINRNVTDARFRMVNGAPTKVADAKEGYQVDVDASTRTALQDIQAYTGGDKLQVDLTVAVTQPTIKDADLSAIKTPDLLGTGQTSYVGSSPERAWNVGLGTRNIDGALIPPGGVFSTDETIGDLTLAAGFKMGYAIVNTGSGLTTVPAEAGGICQVATTLFHSVFWAGLPIVERNWHSYWIGLYGLPPSGLQGLDATIAPPDKDFRFKNTTGNWLLVKATADGKNVTFQLYGVNPGWKVSVAGPIITNKVKTNPAMITENSSALPAGKKVLVEHAQDGFDAQITRTVTDAGGNVVDHWVARSHYEPAHNRTLVGTGK